MIRTSAQALKAAQLRWGKNAAVRDSGKPSTAEARQAAHEQRQQLLATVPKDRRERTPEQRKELDRLLSSALAYRFSVGAVELGGLCFAVKGYGDTWQAAMDHADATNHYTRPFPHPIGCADCRRYRQCCTCKSRLRGRIAKDGQCADCRTTEGKR